MQCDLQYETAWIYTIKKQVSRYFSSFFFLLNNEGTEALLASSKVKLRFFTLNTGILLRDECTYCS